MQEIALLVPPTPEALREENDKMELFFKHVRQLEANFEEVVTPEVLKICNESIQGDTKNDKL